MKKLVKSRALLIVCSAVASLVPANASILTNGDFSVHSSGFGQLTVSSYAVTGWTGGGKEGNFGSTTTPPVFLFAGLATGTNGLSNGVSGDAFMGTVDFFGGSALSSPSGGTVIAADGDPAWAGSLSQTVNGLTTGDTYELNFDWAGAQQQGFAGNTTEKWQVSFGSNTLSTSTVSTPSQTFAGWQTGTLDFTATSASELLKFLAVGSPSGEPPWLLLSNVSMTDTTASAAPEPASIALVLGGAGLIIGLGRRLRKRA
jgi:hypothetical protein